jgi:hypothetical protein
MGDEVLEHDAFFEVLAEQLMGSATIRIDADETEVNVKAAIAGALRELADEIEGIQHE